MKATTNTVYLWEENAAILGYAKFDINGVKESFGGGYKIEDKDEKKSKSGLHKNRAIRQVKTQFVNVVNALNLYGDKILDKEGNVDPKEFLSYEKASSRSIAKGKKEAVDDLMDIKKLKTKMLTFKQASKLNLSNEK